MALHILSACFFAHVLWASPSVVQASSNRSSPAAHQVTVTAYTNSPCCTNDKPNLTASSLEITPEHYKKIVALSPDLARNYEFGDQFYLHVRGRSYLVEYQDKTSRRHKNRIDFLLPSKKECKKFGITRGTLVPVEPR